MTPTDIGIREALARAARARGDTERDGAERLAALLSLDAWFDFTAPVQDEARRGRILRRKFEATQWLAAAAALSDTLRQGNVRHCFVKGAALVGRVYAPGERSFVDLDLLVYPDDVGRFLETAAEAGYAVEPDAARNAPPSMRRGYDLTGPEIAGVGAVPLDANWAIAPVNRLLSYADADAIAPLWDRIATDGPLPAPAPADHLAVIVHHLAHHDLLHVRGLLDAIRLLEVIPSSDDARIERTAGRLGVRRLTRTLVDVAVRGLGATPRAGIGAPPAGWRGRRLRDLIDPARWFAWVADAPPHEHLEITPARIRRRLLVLDRLADAARLARDVVFPPAAYLRWRWKTRSTLRAWRAHLGRLAGKAGA